MKYQERKNDPHYKAQIAAAKARYYLRKKERITE